MRRVLSAALGMGFIGLSSSCAFASVTQPVPPGSAASSATALFRISSDYLGAPGTQPFAADPFTFQATVPDQVSYYHPAGSLSPDAFFLTVSGDYINNGVTTRFSHQRLTFVNGAISEAVFSASNLLKTPDSFDINAFLDGLLFTSVNTGNGYQRATFNPGNYQIDANLNSHADYFGDPQFSGGAGASIIPIGVSEPGSAALLLTGVLGLALASRRKTFA